MGKLIKYTAESGSEISLTLENVRNYIANNQNVTMQEFMMFGAMCKTYRLDPFIREAYLVKYGNNPGTMVVGKDVFTKRAFRHPRFEGFEAGLSIITQDSKFIRRDGSLVFPGERLIGAWAKVYVQGYVKPIFDEVSFEEYAGKKKDGSLNRTWSEKPGTMIRKVALVHALREAFPEEFGGLYDQAEMQIEEQPDTPIQTYEPTKEDREMVEKILSPEFAPWEQEYSNEGYDYELDYDPRAVQEVEEF